ncbi:hypothetical protein [Pedobacter africanus]|uniref:Uncharacterized protein n=1 Tax=Pedobacter africanus TaxID=151894 RepID=A0A1W2A4J9_9SPHI|nr:hypothetical protein [Pedobacter africanus]SMC55198.1 hypothetical protein SAMN04488524_1204 [Pedobacter africanus]
MRKTIILLLPDGLFCSRVPSEKKGQQRNFGPVGIIGFPVSFECGIINGGILLSARHKSSQHKLKESIEKALHSDNEKRAAPLKIAYNCEIVLSKETPELSIVDYLLWALQRNILRGESRFYKALIDKYTLIIDLYDNEQHYTVDRLFDPGKSSELRTDGYI